MAFKYRKMMIPICFFLLLFVVLLSISCANTMSSVAGTYSNSAYPNFYLKLEKDGTYSGYAFFNLQGTWEVSGDEVLLYTNLGLETYKIEGNTLTNKAGSWIKK